MGFTGLALGAMLHRDGVARADAATGWTPPDGKPHFPPKAKSVIWLFMNGGVSHLETFDPKPMLNKYAGKTIAETPYKDVQDPEKLKLARVVVVNDANGQQRNKLYPLAGRLPEVRPERHRGQRLVAAPRRAASTTSPSIRSMYTTDDNHGAQTQFHSGRHMLDGEFPTLGAWVHYGLGLAQRQPAAVHLDGQPRVLERQGRPLPRPGPRRRAAPRRPGQPARLRQARAATSAPTSSGSASTWSAG